MTEDSNTTPASTRIKSAMVLFAVEEALGSYVVQTALAPESIPSGLRAEIQKRVTPATTAILPTTQLVQATYIKEIIDLAIAASQGKAEQEPLKRLKKLVESLDVFDIRNAVCHPNRPFPDCYWHRMAAIATDPAIDSLRLQRVTDAFRCAVEGRIIPPPDGWLQQRAWCVPNNLPSSFDHEITGLIARSDEANELKKRLRSTRNTFLALIGPGGTGKTALCLEVLRDCALDPTTLGWADEIVYASAKTERLTANGIETILDPVASIDAVQKLLATTLLAPASGSVADPAFGDAVSALAERRVLVCIDNLETLLRDHPATFEDFVQALPAAWRVIVTSRVAVNGANALSVGPIRREGALKLARDYLSVRGATRLPEQQLNALVDVCDRNPLAIRLSVDSYTAGADLQAALAQTKEHIIEFSYTSLIDHLPGEGAKVLECLFGSNGPLGRAEIGHLLDLSPDRVAETINGLLRTSLVTRQVDGTLERYSLSSSVRELLLRAPRDPAIRAEVYERLREQQRVLAALESKGTRDPLAVDYVPPEAPDHVRALFARLRRSLLGRASRGEQLADLTHVRHALAFDTGEPVLYRAESLLLEQLNDRYGRIESLGKAVGCDRGDPASRLLLAEALRDEQRLSEALEQTDELLLADWLSRSDVSIRSKVRLIRAHWVCALWLKRYEEVIKATARWKDTAEMRPAFAALRVSALQRQLDDGGLSLAEQAIAIEEMITCLSETFRLDGYLADVTHEGFRALDRLQRLLRRRLLLPPQATKCVQFLDLHLQPMCASDHDNSLSDETVISIVRDFRDAPCEGINPLKATRWSEIVDYGESDDVALANAGYETARIMKVYTDRGYAFARALDGSRDFYIHRRTTELDEKSFSALRTGQLLSVLPSEDPPDVGRAWPAKHAMLS